MDTSEKLASDSPGRMDMSLEYFLKLKEIQLVVRKVWCAITEFLPDRFCIVNFFLNKVIDDVNKFANLVQNVFEDPPEGVDEAEIMRLYKGSCIYNALLNFTLHNRGVIIALSDTNTQNEFSLYYIYLV